MAKPNRTPRTPPSNPVVTGSRQIEVVDPRWLARMFGLLVLAALMCGYLTLGLLFYLGSWQLVLHPTHKPNGGTGLPSEKIRFAVNAAGTPQLAGEWLAANTGAPRSAYAVLYLTGADGQLDAGDGTQIASLHDLGLNVLAFDYRGYGDSQASPHPSEATMLADVHSAWSYLTETKKVSPDHILVFGNGIGVSLAAQLLSEHKDAGGLIGYNADPEVLGRVRRDPRSKLFPLRVVFHDAFSLDTLRQIRVPKLLYTVGPLDPARTNAYRTAADPKLTIEVPTHDAGQERTALTRFLGEVAPVQEIAPLLP